MRPDSQRESGLLNYRKEKTLADTKIFSLCARARGRTWDLSSISRMLYQLSYARPRLFATKSNITENFKYFNITSKSRPLYDGSSRGASRRCDISFLALKPTGVREVWPPLSQ
jgi:hypothetical protein